LGSQRQENTSTYSGGKQNNLYIHKVYLLQTIFSPIYDLLDHKNFSGLPSRKIREAKDALKSALKGYPQNQRERTQ
jgi:hypothetical protein